MYGALRSEHCFLKADCRPLHRQRELPHKLQFCITQKKKNILRAHCNYMAGKCSPCNHIAAALFRVATAMKPVSMDDA